MTERKVVIGRQASPPVRKGEWEFAFDAVEGVPAIEGLAYRCPCGCGAENYVDLTMEGLPWNGDADRPSIQARIETPSCGTQWSLVKGAWL